MRDDNHGAIRRAEQVTPSTRAQGIESTRCGLVKHDELRSAPICRISFADSRRQ